VATVGATAAGVATYGILKNAQNSDDDDGPAEHTKGARPSTRNRHEEGQARQQRDRERAERRKKGQTGKKKKGRRH
jgi:hypothetical protein